jgi:glutathione synthase/RimK-type ligase-like ATP-grasp enzyme
MNELPADLHSAADTPIGVARLSRLAFEGVDLGPLRSQLIEKYIFEPDNAAALMDLATVEQLFGNVEDGLARQQEALSLRQLYRRPSAAPQPALRMLALAAAGDLGLNTPLEFLLEGSDVELMTLYLQPGADPLRELPEHDLAFVAASQSDATEPVLAQIAALAAEWPKPIVNRPERVALLARDRLVELLKPIPGIVMPGTFRIERRRLARLAAELGLPVIARPVDSHAGRGLLKLEDEAGIAAYLAERREAEFYLSPFIDYRDADGLFRKYRIAFIAGRPYACHMAIAEQWMIYYLNAGMRDSAAKRAEEEHFMTGFDEGFARRHEAALAALAAAVDLDYFGIDCAETPDGKLLIFEADIAMIVHDMDSPEIYPYKRPQMRKVFDAFIAMLKQRAAAGRSG